MTESLKFHLLKAQYDITAALESGETSDSIAKLETIRDSIKKALDYSRMSPVEKFVEDFRYERSRWGTISGWHLISKEKEGDCEDFAITTLYLIEGSWLKLFVSLLTFRAGLWLCYSSSNTLIPRHMVLWHRDYGWIDSTKTYWRSTPIHTRVFPWLLPLVVFDVLRGKIF